MSNRDNYRPVPIPSRDERDGRMYDDRQHRSRSRDRYRRNSPPQRRLSSPQDLSRTPPRGPAADRDAGRDWDRRQDYDSYSRRDKSPSPRSRGRHQNRDREDYRSPRAGSQSHSGSGRGRSRSPSHAGFGGAPSRDIILDGLPIDIVEEDISHELESNYKVKGLEDVRVIRDRVTGISRQFGFLRFSSLDHSHAFLDTNHPTIYLYGTNESEGTKVRIAYSRRPEDEWRCRKCKFSNYATRNECFRCKEPKRGGLLTSDLERYDADGLEPSPTNPLMSQKPSNFTNTGDQDVSTTTSPSQYLLLRNLDPSVTEELLAKGMLKLYKSYVNTQPPSNSKKVAAKVISTTNDSSLGAKDGSLKRVLLIRDRRTNESWRYGFAEFGSVEDAQAALAKFNAAEKFTIASKPILASYIHAGVFVPAWNYDASKAKFTFSLLSNPATRLAYWDQDAYAQELIQYSEDVEDVDMAGGKGETNNTEKNSRETETKAKKRKADLIPQVNTKKSAPAHLQFWSNRHAELHGIERQNPAAEDSSPPKSESKKPSRISPDALPKQSFADRERKCCLLCLRQFKSDEEVNKHERLSQLHRDNLKNEEKKAKALQKLAKANSEDIDSRAYRDRAKERRQAFNQPKKPVGEPSKGGKPATVTLEKAEVDVLPVVSKGAALLGKMGWSVGEGLGAEGTGIVAPIQTDMYVQGVGLGAQGGKVGDAANEGERNTKDGYKGFLEKTKETAKERFHSLG